MRGAPPCVLLLGLMAAGCDSPTANPRAVGQLTSERIELNAPDAEPIVEIAVVEGAGVQAGDVVLRILQMIRSALPIRNMNWSRLELPVCQQRETHAAI